MMPEPTSYQRGDQVEIAHGHQFERRWVSAVILFKAHQFGRGMYQVKYEDDRQDAIHVSRIRLVEHTMARV